MSFIGNQFIAVHMPDFRGSSLPESPDSIYTPFYTPASHIKAAWALTEMYLLGKRDSDSTNVGDAFVQRLQTAEFNIFKTFVLYVAQHPSVYKEFLKVVAGLQAQYAPMRSEIRRIGATNFEEVNNIKNTVVDLMELLWFMPENFIYKIQYMMDLAQNHVQTARGLSNFLNHIRCHFIGPLTIGGTVNLNYVPPGHLLSSPQYAQAFRPVAILFSEVDKQSLRNHYRGPPPAFASEFLYSIAISRNPL